MIHSRNAGEIDRLNLFVKDDMRQNGRRIMVDYDGRPTLKLLSWSENIGVNHMNASMSYERYSGFHRGPHLRGNHILAGFFENWVSAKGNDFTPHIALAVPPHEIYGYPAPSAAVINSLGALVTGEPDYDLFYENTLS